MVADYTTPDGKSLARDLMSCLNAAVDYLVRCRPLSVSMGNAIKTIKLGISKIDPSGEHMRGGGGGDGGKGAQTMTGWLCARVTYGTPHM
jgi:hypothetical protein